MFVASPKIQAIGPSQDDVNIFFDKSQIGYQAGQVIALGGVPSVQSLPVTGIIDERGRFETFGLAQISADPVYDIPGAKVTMPFTFHDAEISNLQAIIDRIENATGEGADENFDVYLQSLDKLEQLINFHQTIKSTLNVKVDIWGVLHNG